MLLGFRNKPMVREMSKEDFFETYARPKRSSSGNVISADAEPTECTDKSHPTRSNSLETAQIGQNSTSFFKTEPNYSSSQSPKKSDMNVVSQFSLSFDSRRRGSKLQHVASKLSRKSLRYSRRKGDLCQTSSGTVPTSPCSGSKWNSFLFKRDKNTSKSKSETDSYSSDHTSNEDEYQKKVPVTATSTNGFRSFKRSISYQTLTSSSPVSSAPKRSSLYLEKNQAKPLSVPEFDFVNNNPSKPVACKETSTRPAFLPFSLTSSAPLLASSELNVIKKFDNIREEEESRQVAMVTLLKRRKNSIKIKCDQFAKELAQKNLDEDRSKIICDKMKQMKRKMEIVNQCIEEQTEGIKATEAKMNLALSLELYKLNLMQEEKNGFYISKQRRKQNSISSLSASCDTLLSVDDTCVFDDASSLMSSKKSESTNSSPTHNSRRYRVFGSSTNFGMSFANSRQTDECMNMRASADRSHSIDNTVTSDCDSGFDNGDGLSRSDVSLNRSFSKSTSSITSASGSTRINHPRSISYQESSSTSKLSSRQYFFSERPHATSEINLFGENQQSRRKFSPSSSKLESSQTVDPSVLATIEDFEKFADRTQRRLSLHGRLVPLKKGN